MSPPAHMITTHTLHLSIPTNLPHHPHPASTCLPPTHSCHNPLISLPHFFPKRSLPQQDGKIRGLHSQLGGLEDWRARGESEHIVCGSPRGICPYSARNHTSCRDGHLVWMCLLGGADMGSAPSPQPGSCCPAIFCWKGKGSPN